MLFFSASSSVKRLAFTSHVLAHSFLYVIYPHTLAYLHFSFTSISFLPWPKLWCLFITLSVVLPLCLWRPVAYFRRFRYNWGYPLWSQTVTVLKKKKSSSINVLITDVLSKAVSQLCQEFLKGWRPSGACSIWYAFFCLWALKSNKKQPKYSH